MLLGAFVILPAKQPCARNLRGYRKVGTTATRPGPSPIQRGTLVIVEGDTYVHWGLDSAAIAPVLWIRVKMSTFTCPALWDFLESRGVSYRLLSYVLDRYLKPHCFSDAGFWGNRRVPLTITDPS